MLFAVPLILAGLVLYLGLGLGRWGDGLARRRAETAPIFPGLVDDLFAACPLEDDEV